MKEKKQSANWYIAATHYLTTVVMLFVLGLIVGVIEVILHIPSVSGFDIFNLVMAVFTVWLATRYAAKFINNQYIISDKKKIIALSTVYMVIIYVLFNLAPSASKINLSYRIVNVIWVSGLFYFFSQKYVSDNSTQLPSPQVIQQSPVK